MSDVFPCTISPAPPTVPPYTSPMHWCPRHTPSTGVVGPSRSIASIETPASFGVHGPGETTSLSGFIAAIWSTVTWSLRSTCTSAPSSHRYWYRLYVKLS